MSESRDPEIEEVLRTIPDKTYYRIGEVARIAQVKPYVLRFWETEFNVIAPSKSRSKQRMYRKRDIETILRIKKLLYQQGFTIKGARRRLLEGSSGARAGAADERGEVPELDQIRLALEEIKGLLNPRP